MDKPVMFFAIKFNSIYCQVYIPAVGYSLDK